MTTLEFLLLQKVAVWPWPKMKLVEPNQFLMYFNNLDFCDLPPKSICITLLFHVTTLEFLLLQKVAVWPWPRMKLVEPNQFLREHPNSYTMTIILGSAP
ncbi:hypothetical protein GDO81_025372 [Engystomops pustulosus]|uniref:Uncharacterized protein n=1 Tax=Engystomops pustulosus TaxID=76066 RepID=A0AAV6Z9E9_ENGPU|nr:hypothetical protein GDO81_025372 [Engystomops pustulosus]